MKKRTLVIIFVVVMLLVLGILFGAAKATRAAGPTFIHGDANEDGVVNMADITYVERVILTLNPATPECDVNQNGVIDMGDVIHIERIILGYEK